MNLLEYISMSGFILIILRFLSFGDLLPSAWMSTYAQNINKLYQTRKIRFREIVQVNDWKVKVYTISKTGEFNHPIFYENVLKQLPTWLNKENSFNASHDHVAFLILHIGKEGIFSLINWGVDTYMMCTHVFLTDPAVPNEFTYISGDGLGPCNWELEVIYHERIAWMNHVVKNPNDNSIQNYLSDVINIEV